MSKEVKGTNVPVAQSAQTPTAATAAKQPANNIAKAESKKSLAEELGGTPERTAPEKTTGG
jgi:hypothetical protein